jgi:hypothetical protein
MRRKTMGLVIAVVIIMWTGALFAQTVTDIHVRAVGLRPGCALPEGFIETYNCGSLCYRLSVKRDYAKDTANIDCSGCDTVNGCGNIYPADKCSTRIDSDSDPLVGPVILGPAGSGNFCGLSNDCLPTGTCQPCDNRLMANGCGSATCNTSGEWCSEYSSVKVQITGYGSVFHGHCPTTWTTTGMPVTVCASGIYATGGVPSCATESYCDLPFGQRVNPRQGCSGWTELDPACDEQY